MADLQAYLGGVPFRTGPDEVRWDFTMKVNEQRTLGGKVIQILGTRLGDITMTGMFGSGARGDEVNTNWQEQIRLRKRLISLVRQTEDSRGGTPIEFHYPRRGWNFGVLIKQIAPTSLANEEIAPRWTIQMMPVDAAASALTRDITDVYIQRLMDGVGWKQTDYNGPNPQEVTAKLSGRTFGEYLAQEAQAKFESGLAGGQIGAPDEASNGQIRSGQ